jgi:hypothetical protein
MSMLVLSDDWLLLCLLAGVLTLFEGDNGSEIE